MTTQVTATALIDPLGQPSAGTVVRITALDSVETLLGMTAEIRTTDTGAYDFNLLNGDFEIDINFKGDEFNIVERIRVTSETPTPITLPVLISEHRVPTA